MGNMDYYGMIILKKENKRLEKESWIWIYIVVLYMILIFICLFLLYHNRSLQPRIELYKSLDNIEWQGKYYTKLGFFQDNNINILINTSIEETLLHEYGHWLYDNKMTYVERSKFNQFCIPEWAIDGYERKNVCPEVFAYQFSKVIRYNFNISNMTASINYVSKIANKYLKSEN